MTRLARRGPHKVLRGDLGFVGVPGQLFTPDRGTGLPLVVFAHAWMADAARYRDLLFHLATHGIVVAAPDVERGLAPSDVALAAGLRTAAATLPTVRLGLAESITVDAGRRGYAGHGFGASAAVLAAGTDVLAATEPVAVNALAAVFPAPSTATAAAAAPTVGAPAMVLAVDGHLDTVDANPLPLARELAGPVTLRVIPGASERGLLQRRGIKSLIGINGADKATHATVRTLLTGFFLATIGGDDEYAAFTDADEVLGAVVNVDPDEPDTDDRPHVEKLLSGPITAQKGGPLSAIRALRGR
ncbi:alpha/beta hydrolase [Gordonia crocea]|uniref:Alpha/beta hydrolase n=2 Tax=Gordonia crocea TaxID=589162 RepID=A0A7I9UWA6_9ACTN|nr:alpha/beta hydrolase [Gordonia crocea]